MNLDSPNEMWMELVANFDECGSKLRRQHIPGREFVDLTPLKTKVIPAITPVGYHYHQTSEGRLEQYAYFCKTGVCKPSYSAVEQMLARDHGIKHLLYIDNRKYSWYVRFSSIDMSEHTGGPLWRPRTVAEFLGRATVKAPAAEYPHVCPRCGGPAYIGLFNIDCSRGCT